jgi:hypothetical protein
MWPFCKSFPEHGNYRIETIYKNRARQCDSNASLIVEFHAVVVEICSVQSMDHVAIYI